MSSSSEFAPAAEAPSHTAGGVRETNYPSHRNSHNAKKKKGGTGIDATHLLNFHTATNPNEVLLSQHSRLSKRNAPKKVTKTKSAAEQRIRNNLSSNFYLYSSPIHGFVLKDEVDGEIETRMIPPWSDVCAVRCLIDVNSSENSNSFCPICLEDNVFDMMAPRIGKCGHVFCYPCILRHLLSPLSEKKQQPKFFFNQKCPCCADEMVMEELRPVFFVLTTTTSSCPPKLQQKMHFTKLYRRRQPKDKQLSSQKSTLAPQFPFSTMNSHHLRMPFVSDPHAKFYRWNLLDPSWYLDQIIRPHISSILKQLASSDPISKLYLEMTLQSIEQEQLLYIANESCISSKLNHMKIQEISQNLNDNSKFHEDSVKKENQSVESDQIVPTLKQHDDVEIETIADGKKKEHIQSRHGKKKINRDELIRSQCHHYLPQDWTHFYQSSDGQLCFLSGFNMNCLATDFAMYEGTTATITGNYCDDQNGKEESNTEILPPFPDTIEGIVLGMEHVHLTHDIRTRMPFLSHLPLFTDIIFCELDLNYWLSSSTFKKFRPQFEQRKKKRQSIQKKEKKETRLAKQKDKERVQKLLSMQQPISRIDPNDEFFHALPLSDEFGPSLPSSTINEKRPIRKHISDDTSSHSSFRAVCASNGLYPDLNSTSNYNAFPALSSATSDCKAPNANNNLTWGRNIKKSPIPATMQSTANSVQKKKNKGKKIVLFSTGGNRGM